MESKSVIVLPRSNGLERYKVSSCGFYATACGSRVSLISCSGLNSSRKRSGVETGRLCPFTPTAGVNGALVSRRGSLFLAALYGLDQLHIQAERLQLANQHVE